MSSASFGPDGIRALRGHGVGWVTETMFEQLLDSHESMHAAVKGMSEDMRSALAALQVGQRGAAARILRESLARLEDELP